MIAVDPMTVPKNHPRYLSLTTRDRLVDGWKKGLVATQGLIAHGRGEAFDYLIGEKTSEEAERSIEAAAAMLLLAERPVISVNGNVGTLSAADIRELWSLLDCQVEVNIFHRTEERMDALIEHLEENGIMNVLGRDPDRRIPGLEHARAMCTQEGIFGSDVVLVPLEDGDRCRALVEMGKKVITIDLNPLSRTSQTANVTIVDNIIRAIPALTSKIRDLKEAEKEELQDMVDDLDNIENLNITLKRIAKEYGSP